MAGNRPVSAANLVTAVRLLLLAPLWALALSGNTRVVGIGLILAGVTDVLDGRLARRLVQESVRGAQMDAIADTALLISAAAWLGLLYPEIMRDNTALLGVVAGAYAANMAAEWLGFHRIGNPRQLSAKLAGGLLYAFALFTFLTGDYEAALLRLALFALLISSVEGLVAATRTIQASGMASSNRSQAPNITTGDASNASPIASMKSSAIPVAQDVNP
jgi:phosphatidylglycerophosphate synthase